MLLCLGVCPCWALSQAPKGAGMEVSRGCQSERFCGSWSPKKIVQGKRRAFKNGFWFPGGGHLLRLSFAGLFTTVHSLLRLQKPAVKQDHHFLRPPLFLFITQTHL